jgi:hypothetical protein
MAEEKFNKAVDSSDRVKEDNYDKGIVPAETAARREREGDQFKTTPTEEREASAITDDQTHLGDSIRTTDGYTVDKEGLLNNYAVEPEMYYDTPGDAAKTAAADEAARVEELQEINEDKQGELSETGDKRGRGPGAV